MVIQELNNRIIQLATEHSTYRVGNTDSFQTVKKDLGAYIQQNKVDVEHELDQISQNLLRRYFV